MSSVILQFQFSDDTETFKHNKNEYFVQINLKQQIQNKYSYYFTKNCKAY